MCYLLFVPVKMYLFVYYFRVDSVVLTLLLLFLGHSNRDEGD
jgi:hypothetical protein